jgi:hypothetical protein
MKKSLVSAFGFIILILNAIVWAAPVPDTGVTKCYNATAEIPCPSSGQPFYGQDAQYTINPMSFTKLDGSGSVRRHFIRWGQHNHCGYGRERKSGMKR